MTEYDHILAGGLVLLSLMLALGAAPNEATPERRWSFYRQGWLTGIGMSAVALLVWHAAGRAAEDFGIRSWFGDRPDLSATAALLWAVLIVLSVAAVRAGRGRPRLEAIYRKYRALMPTSKKELVGSWGTAVAAGTGEEIAFRGFLLWYVGSLTDHLLALFATTFLFGIAHGYQKASGVIFASAAGLILGTVYLVSGSLLLVAWMHASWNVASFTIGMILLTPVAKHRLSQASLT